MSSFSLPSVSVIMPVRNEAVLLPRSLEAVLAQDYPSHLLEVLVVDGGSSDGTREILERYQRSDSRLRILDNPAGIVPSALNLAIREARGQVIVRVDAHAVIAPDYVRKCVEYLTRGEADNVGGPMRPRGTTYFGQAVALATSSPFGIGGSRFHYSKKRHYVDTVYLGAYWRQIFDRIGPFNEELICNQDYELNHRLRAAGGRILCTPDIRSVYYCRNSPGALFRQYFRYGFWKVRTVEKHPSSLKIRQLVAPAFVGILALLFLLGLLLPTAWKLLGAILLLYMILAASFGLSRALSSGSLLHWPATILAFLILHLAWGLGFWAGLLALWRKRRGERMRFEMGTR